jgi:hypothetical protein
LPSARFADFHSLRYTRATFLQRNGIAQRFAMKLLRHSDIKLTAKLYTDETQLPIYDSIKNLPRLGDYTQIRAQILDSEGRNVAQADAKSEGSESDKPIVNGGDCLGLAPLVTENELERVKGIEPSFHEPLLARQGSIFAIDRSRLWVTPFLFNP